MLLRRRRPCPHLQTGKPLNQDASFVRQRRKRSITRSSSGKGPQKMNIMATTTTLPHTAACGEPIGLFHSIGEDISPPAERHPPAKNRRLPGPARCLGPSSESLRMEAPQPHPYPSSIEGGVLYNGHRDSFRRPGCPAAVHSWHRPRHRRNSGRRSSFRSRHDTGRSRQGAGHRPSHNRRPDHHWERCQGSWDTSHPAGTTVAVPRTVGLRDVPDASTVIGVRRRTVFQNGRRVLTDSELDDDPSSDQCRLCREVMRLSRCGTVTR
jgi:hypothetical protein